MYTRWAETQPTFVELALGLLSAIGNGKSRRSKGPAASKGRSASRWRSYSPQQRAAQPPTPTVRDDGIRVTAAPAPVVTVMGSGHVREDSDVAAAAKQNMDVDTVAGDVAPPHPATGTGQGVTGMHSGTSNAAVSWTIYIDYSTRAVPAGPRRAMQSRFPVPTHPLDTPCRNSVATPPRRPPLPNPSPSAHHVVHRPPPKTHTNTNCIVPPYIPPAP